MARTVQTKQKQRNRDLVKAEFQSESLLGKRARRDSPPVFPRSNYKRKKEGKDSGRPSGDVEEDGDVIVTLSESVTLTKGMTRLHHQIDGQMTRAPCLECVYRLAQTGTVLECPNDLDSGFYNTEWETDESWFWAQTTDEAENDHGHTMHVLSCPTCLSNFFYENRKSYSRTDFIDPANEELRKEVFIKIHEWRWSIDRRVKLKTKTESEEERKAAKEQALDELTQVYEKWIDESRTFVEWKPRMRATQRKMSMVKKVVWRLWVSGRT